jgi:hypothetical protein
LSAPHSAIRGLAAATIGILAAISLVGPASAKEPNNTVVSTTLPPPPTGCTPVHSFRVSGDPSVGDTGLSSISADYQVQACDSHQPVALAVLVTEAFDTTNVLRDEANAPLSGKFTLGARLGVDYRVTLTVRDAGTGATIAEASRLVSAPVPTKA